MMSYRIPKIKNNVQGRKSVAWKKLCEYVDKVALERSEEFDPLKELGPRLYAKIYTLPESISKLKNVKKIVMYGSKLKRIPPEIGEMDALEYFDTYTSLDLHWFPFEITHCKNLKASRVSYKALYGNRKKPIAYPRLHDNPVRYLGNTLKCSICSQEISYEQTDQFWLLKKVGTFELPLLVNVCSANCEDHLPQKSQFPSDPYAHKGSPSVEELKAAGITVTGWLSDIIFYCKIAGFILCIPFCIFILPFIIIYLLPRVVTDVLGMLASILLFLFLIVETIAVVLVIGSVIGNLFQKKP